MYREACIIRITCLFPRSKKTSSTSDESNVSLVNIEKYLELTRL